MHAAVGFLRLAAATGLAGAVMIHAAGHPTIRAQTAASSAVSVREETIVIPTYPTGEPLKAPMFFAGRTYQGAKGPMYPYVLVDRLSDTIENRTYRIVWLENEYVKVGILPDLGGRIWAGQDKTNGYDFFYRNHVIKPALIGMVGAWISGGVEWNIPHHHRASTFMPVQYRVESGSDGSCTVWVGELELRHRMRWTVGVTLHPGRSNVDASVRLVNRTPLPHSFLYFSNVAVHAGDQYQVIFPPSTQFGVHHAKREFVRWPIADGDYGGVTFKDVDVSWWKNHPTPTSIFAWNYEDDFLAGYDHGRRAGTLHVADHRTVPGKKFFEWGPGPEGAFWDSILTDKDGPYLELMVGGYSDNQPDYTWIQPNETKSVEQSWYPIRDLGGVKQATREAAVNLEPASAGAVHVAFNASAEYRDATVRLMAGSTVLLDRRVTVGPATPFSEVVTVPAGTAHTALRASLVAKDGRELVAYQPRALEKRPMPPPVAPPPPPEQFKSSEELFLAGLRLEQFYSPAAEPEPYYEEALKRDPGDARAHTALGVRLLKRGLYTDAGAHFERAVARIAHNYTSPRDADAYYYLGVARAALGDDTGADAALAKSAWDRAWRSPASTRLAEIAARRGAWTEVLTRADEAIAADARNTRAHVIRAVALLKLDRAGEAVAATDAALAIDPLDHWARYVRAGARAGVSGGGVIGSVPSSGATAETVLETAADYESLGLIDLALSVLQFELPSAPPRSSEHAMVQYVMADYAERLGRRDEAARYASAARAASTDYVFPFRLEHVAILRRAMLRDPQDPRAPYYLGNLLMDIQPEAAIEAWRTAARLDPGFAMAHRNLGWAAARRDAQPDDAITEYERAIAADPKEPVYYYELDRLYERANRPPESRYALLDAHRDTLALRDDAMSRLVTVSVRLGKYDEALALLAGRRYHTWEGGTRFLVHDEYVDAHLLRGGERFRARRFAEALADYRAALEYPPNLGVGRPSRGGRTAEARYLEGRAFAALKRLRDAREAWTVVTRDYDESYGAALPATWAWSSAQYYQARAFEALGERERARRIFEGLRAAGEARVRETNRVDFFAKFGERESPGRQRANAHYLLGLGHLGLGQEAEARAAFEAALRADVSHVWAAARLAEASR